MVWFRRIVTSPIQRNFGKPRTEPTHEYLENAVLNERLKRQIEFLIEIDKLKAVLRQNYLADASRRENDAEHSWHLALMAIVLSEWSAESEIDLAKVIRMVLMHDLVEIDTGDVFVYDEAARAAHAQREEAAAERIFSLLPNDQAREFRALWDEFEARETAEARYAAALDRLQPLLLNYHSGGLAWRKHRISAAQVRRINRRIQDGAPNLWEFAQGLIQEAETEGLLRSNGPGSGEDRQPETIS
jgi:putative hydrolase of HD superfamily